VIVAKGIYHTKNLVDLLLVFFKLAIFAFINWALAFCRFFSPERADIFGHRYLITSIPKIKVMKNLPERQKVKTSFLREFSRISKIKADLIQNRKTQGLVPSQDLSSARVIEQPHRPGARKITQCILPPFQEALGGSYDHPRSVFEPNDFILDVYNHYSFPNPVTGEMSLAIVSGQNLADFYGGGTPYYFGRPSTGFYQQTACAIFSPRINLTPYEYDTHVEITVDAELPSNPGAAVKFVLGAGDDPLHGELAAFGWLDLYTGAAADHDYVTRGVTYMFLGASGIVGDPPVIITYDPNPHLSYSFNLPAGSDHFWIHVNGQINALSTVPETPYGASTEVTNYALVDFREENSEFPILRSREYLNEDHPAPGTLKIKKICYSIEPRFIKLPDTQ
jgi:hypothetical protein